MEIVSKFIISGIPRIEFGAGKISELPGIISSYGKNVLFVLGGESFKKSLRYELLINEIEKAKISHYSVSVKSEPSPDIIDDAAKEFRKRPINVVVSIGGGSVLDAGKAISAMLAEEGSVRDYLEGVGRKKVSGAKAPFIAVPTTSGTGSEATKNAVVSVVGLNGFKKSLRHDSYMPDIALVDPELMISCPKETTASCGLDAISQLIESYISTKANPFTDSLALYALGLAAESFLPVSTDAGEDISHRSNMAYAALVSGITLSQAGLGTVHGIAGPIGGLFHVPHGIACGTLLSPVMRETIIELKKGSNTKYLAKIAKIGMIFSGESGKSDMYYCDRLVEVIDSWVRETNIPKLGKYGITKSDIAAIIKESDNKSNPVILSDEVMAKVLEERI